jgi:RNA-binding protein NOB1
LINSSFFLSSISTLADGEAEVEKNEADVPESSEQTQAEAAQPPATENVVPVLADAETTTESKEDEALPISPEIAQDPDVVVQITSDLASSSLADKDNSATTSEQPEQLQNPTEIQEDSDPDSDGGGWITPGNLKKKQAEDASASTKQTPEPKTMQVAVLTSDFAMQNVILQMNLNLLSPSMARVKYLKTYVMRCHACFNVSKDLSKQFCARCGQPSLTRVSCSTSANGEFKLHLKKNMQWNSRGDRYSIPKPVHGSSNGRIKGGGKGGWGNDLILAEDQKEYQHAAVLEKRHKERNLMDEDYLPSILTGDRAKTGGRVRVGAGRGVNSKKR